MLASYAMLVGAKMLVARAHAFCSVGRASCARRLAYIAHKREQFVYRPIA